MSTATERREAGHRARVRAAARQTQLQRSTIRICELAQYERAGTIGEGEQSQLDALRRTRRQLLGDCNGTD